MELYEKLFLRISYFRIKIQINYETSPDATALQWLTAEQTAGGVHPYLFSQCQVNRK